AEHPHRPPGRLRQQRDQLLVHPGRLERRPLLQQRHPRPHLRSTLGRRRLRQLETPRCQTEDSQREGPLSKGTHLPRPDARTVPGPPPSNLAARQPPTDEDATLPDALLAPAFESVRTPSVAPASPAATCSSRVPPRPPLSPPTRAVARVGLEECAPEHQ